MVDNFRRRRLSQDTQLVKELLGKLVIIENEMTLLRDDRKNALEEYKEKLDIKAFRAALRIFKIRQQTDNDFMVDEMLEAMEIDNG